MSLGIYFQLLRILLNDPIRGFSGGVALDHVVERGPTQRVCGVNVCSLRHEELDPIAV